MLEALSFTILKSLASTCVKFYVASLLGAGQISYDAKELG